ncbi:efflux RND transporter periplasmic adaptor subunit [Gorillibacterium sp. sgz5001074]|uniref:efflux RND transporter periplasmic adaptor subunit n=1 Tax=Gorillibacterium sp. sgz5001074 TaxID=3446695 RepID=UPI003F6730F0
MSDNRKDRSSRRTWAAALALTAAVALSGCTLLPKEEEALKPPLVKPVEEQYNTVKVTAGTVAKELRGSATYESTKTEYAQFAEQGGRLLELKVKPGDQVKKGDVLVQLDVEGLDLKLKEQELALEKAKLALKKAWSDPAKDPDNLRIAELAAELEQLKLDHLRRTFTSKQLTAAMDGQVIYASDLKPGDTVAAYQTLVTLADPTRLRLMMRVDNTNDIGEAVVGMEAKIKSDKAELSAAIVQTPSTAPVTTDKALAEKNAKTLYLELASLPPEAKIGGSVQVTIPTQKKDNVLKIPRSGLRNYMGRTFVQVLDGKSLREVDVEAGLQSPTEIEIVKGLKEGQDIVLN